VNQTRDNSKVTDCLKWDENTFESCQKDACVVSLIGSVLFDFFFAKGFQFGSWLSRMGKGLGGGTLAFEDRTFSLYGPPIQCSDLSQEELDLHDLLGDLSLALGLGQPEDKISAFELPTILDGWKDRGFFHWIHRDLFMDFACRDPHVANDSSLAVVNCGSVWMEFMKTQKEHPCDIKDRSQDVQGRYSLYKRICCPQGYKSLSSSSLAAVMTLMKWANGRFRTLFNASELTEALKDDQNRIIGYSVRDLSLSSFEVDGQYMQKDKDSYAVTCDFQSDLHSANQDCAYGCPITYKYCQILHPTLTKTGFCYGFNTPTPRQILSPFSEPFIKSFEKAYGSEMRDRKKKALELGFSSGHEDLGFSAVLDRQVIGSVDHRDVPQRKTFSFRVGVGSFLESFHLG